jgi:hypothetical protein
MYQKPWPRQIKCCFLEATTIEEQRLRRYTNNYGECPDINNNGLHQNWVKIGEIENDGRDEEKRREDHSLGNGVNHDVEPGQIYPVSYDDPRWPSHCTCGFKFPDEVVRQYFPERMYRVQGTDTLVTLRNAPAGAMWYATWLEKYDAYKGPDGRCLIVKLPNGNDWTIDSRASNCTLPNDTVHKCWIRHGTPPNITVDKNGFTCAAGAGSILSGQGDRHYHGFLINGELREC